MKGQARALLLGGILPVVAFTLIEEYFGTVWGLIAGMAFGAGEILYEWRIQRRVDKITWIGNGMLLVLGGVSLFTREGIWFKLQPALIEAVMGLILIGSVLAGTPLMMQMLEKQAGGRLEMPPEHRAFMNRVFGGTTFRLGIFFLLHAALATWAALRWSTAAWAFLKGVGFTGSMILYLMAEGWVLRRRLRPQPGVRAEPPQG